MADKDHQNDEPRKREDEATSSQTLDEIEEQQELPADNAHSAPSPDESPGRASGDLES